LAYGAIAGGHLPAVNDQITDLRDAAANAVGFSIASIALTGQKQISREDVLTAAGITGRTSLLFLDADSARRKLKANPWIAEATVLKLYPDRLQIGITERQPFALWQKDGSSRSSPRMAPYSSLTSRAASPACRWWSARDQNDERRIFWR
jgi:cell division protein FtsQ